MSLELGKHLQRDICDLSEEVRALRQSDRGVSSLRYLAGAFQLLVILIALLGFMQLENPVGFNRLMASAILLQLFTIGLLLFARR